MSAQRFTDEQLMAYADGELDAATAARVRAAMQVDAAVAARVKMYADSRRLLREAFEPLLQEPLSPRLQSMLDGFGEDTAAIISISPRAAGRRRLRRWPRALAASVAAAALLSALWLGWHRGAPGDGDLLAAVRALPPVVADVLDHRASGEPVDAKLARVAVEILPLASYASADGYCREFSVESLDGDRPQSLRALACRDGEHWIARAVVDGDAAAPAADDAYHAASGGHDLATRLSQRQMLDDDQERALIAAGWQRRPSVPAE